MAKFKRARRQSKLEKQAKRKEILEYNQRGEGLFVFRNRSRQATLSLPKPSADGKTVVGPANPAVPGSGEWEGDNYFMQLVKSHDAILVREIRGVQEERTMNQEKLILDQPEQVTSEGPVEHVLPATPVKPLNETPQDENAPLPDVLLTEDPMEGVQIIRD